MGHLVHNERLKMMAGFFTNLGVAAFAGGAILPVFSVNSLVSPSAIATLLFGAVLGMILLFIGYWVLSDLKE